jgi:hypothetical protein
MNEQFGYYTHNPAIHDRELSRENGDFLALDGSESPSAIVRLVVFPNCPRFFSATNAIAAWPDIHLQEQRGTAVHED